MNGPDTNDESRHILWPDPNPDANGYRACVVVENEHGYTPYGVMSNDPLAKKPIYIGKTQEEAERWCYEWNAKHFGLSKQEQDLIVLLSIRRQNLQVTYDGDNDWYVVLRGDQEVLTLDCEECEDLIRQLYKRRWPYNEPECFACGEPLERFECVNETCSESPHYKPEDDEDRDQGSESNHAQR